MRKLGLDIGTFSCKYILTDETFHVLEQGSIPHHNHIKDCLLDIIKKLSVHTDIVEIAVCGSMSHLLPLPESCYVNSTFALCKGAEILAPAAKSIISIGAQQTCYLVPHPQKAPLIRHNSNCSSGTGSFFEEQAGRLSISLEEISHKVSQAKTVPNIAGRCSVFSKTDMIHHMQEGVPVEDILLGLCYSMIRNYKANILNNESVTIPVLLSGGVMKNAGVIRALKELLSLQDKDYILDENADYYSSYGCVHLSSTTVSLHSLAEKLQTSEYTASQSSFPPLSLFQDPADAAEFPTKPVTRGEHYLGIDIGSTSINLVLIDQNKEVVYSRYVKNLGTPLPIVEKELERLKNKLGPSLTITKTAVTGSGRSYIGQQIGADFVINEITAQAEGALLFHPETETIFEIGGQDSKYIKTQNGQMVDFEMNKVCAAGTGAFLEEQIKKLGISMEEFLTLALQSKHPCELGSRCTVFIESSIKAAIAAGNAMEDVCAGLAYAIASNYLQRVVNQKEIGDSIAIQGGIAYNEAVICAFRALTGKEIHVSPYFSVTGALGAASLCTSREYLSFNKEKNQALNTKLAFESEQSYLGDYKPPVHSNRPVIGIPRVVFLHKMFPLFKEMFQRLGFDVLLSPLSNREIVALSQQYATEETCYPIKLIYGHIGWLLQHNVSYILLPRLYTIRHQGSVARKDYACMYMQTSPLLMEQAFHLKERGITLLMPELSLQFGAKFMLDSILSMADILGKKKMQMLPAAVMGMRKLIAHSDRLETLAKDFLDTDEPVFVIVSRVYNIIDPVLNMGIEEHLHELGCRIVHLEHLEAGCMNVSEEYKNLYWPFGQHLLTGAGLINRYKNLYPIYITNHGCGPDTAIQHYIQREFGDRPYLHLEVDEHSSKVGVITRLEAFLYSLRLGEDHPQTHYKPETISTVSTKAVTLLPELGIYQPLFRQLCDKEHVCVVPPLDHHHSFHYAMNKEYYSLLLSLEEILRVCEPEKEYRLFFPTDEGSEVWGQYGRLIEQELNRRGCKTVLDAPFVEDFVKLPNFTEIFEQMIKLEQQHAPSSDQKLFVMGEPLCVHKSYVYEQLRRALPDVYSIHRMPLSEALLFHLMDVDRKHAYQTEIQALKKIHDVYAAHCSLYTDMDHLMNCAKGKLDFLVGSFGRYRFAKLLAMDNITYQGVLLVNSNEENTATILSAVQNHFAEEIAIPYLSLNLDFEHEISKEEIATFLDFI